MIEKINFEKAKSIGVDIQGIADEINLLLNSVSLMMEKISGEAWQSANATSFKSDFDSLKGNFTNVFNAVHTMGEAINASGAMYEAGESAGTSE